MSREAHCCRCYGPVVAHGGQPDDDTSYVCLTCTTNGDLRGHRAGSSQDHSDSDPEGSERPGADAAGTAVALTGEDAGAGSGAYPGIDMSVSAAEMRQFMQSTGMLRPQMPLATFKPTVGAATVTVQAAGGGGSGGSGHWATALSQQQAHPSPLFEAAGWVTVNNSVFAWRGGASGGVIQSPPKPIEDGGIVVGEIVAWRCWRVASHGVLHSMSAGSYVWTPGEPATTEGGMKLEPHQMCYGVHAWKTCRDAMAYAAASPSAIVGKILLSGIVIEHERGYRAECGQIESLDWIVSESPARVANDLLSKARAMYGVGGISGALKSVAVATVHGPIILRCLFWAAIALNLGMVALNLLKVLS